MNILGLISQLIGIKTLRLTEDIRDLSKGDCDALNSDKCVYTESHIGHILSRTGFY